MKLNINNYEVEIKVRDTRNLNASKKAAQYFLNWLGQALDEAADHNEKDYPITEREYREAAIAIHDTLDKQGFYNDVK